jgi:hypothetical protein
MGQQFILRAPVPHLPRVKLLYDFGMTSLLGLSYVTANGTGLSIGAGADAVDNPVVDSTTNAKGATLKLKSGVFYDRRGSLLFSVLVGSRRDLAVDANLYPGVVRMGALRPGIWLQVPKAGGVRFGVVSRWGFGIGT